MIEIIICLYTPNPVGFRWTRKWSALTLNGSLHSHWSFMMTAPSPNHHHNATAAGRQGPPWDHCSLLVTILCVRLFFSVSTLPSLVSELDSADTLSPGGESTAGIGFGTSVGTCATCGGNTRGISKNRLTAGIRKAEGKIGRKVYASGNEKGNTHKGLNTVRWLTVCIRKREQGPWQPVTEMRLQKNRNY
jgi:hypothetical protein